MLEVRYMLSTEYNTNIIRFQLSTGFVFCLPDVLQMDQSQITQLCFCYPELPTFALPNFSMIWASVLTTVIPSLHIALYFM